MRLIVIFIIAAPALSIQHYQSCSSEQDSTQEFEDEHPFYHHTASRKRNQEYSKEVKQPESAELETSNKRYIAKRISRHSHKHSKHSNKKNKFLKCICNCLKCDILDKCCRDICKECDTDTSSKDVEREDVPEMSPGNVVFVPYPYPLLMPPLMPGLPMPMPPIIPPNATFPPPPATTSTMASISHDKLWSDRKYMDINKETLLELLNSLGRKESPSVQNIPTRPLKRDVVTEYEVPISDHVLDRLIMQRTVKDINSA